MEEGGKMAYLQTKTCSVCGEMVKFEVFASEPVWIVGVVPYEYNPGEELAFLVCKECPRCEKRVYCEVSMGVEESRKTRIMYYHMPSIFNAETSCWN